MGIPDVLLFPSLKTPYFGNDESMPTTLLYSHCYIGLGIRICSNRRILPQARRITFIRLNFCVSLRLVVHSHNFSCDIGPHQMNCYVRMT